MGSAALKTSITVGNEFRFPTKDNRFLRFGRGRVGLHVSLSGTADSGRGWDWVLAKLEVADQLGRIARLETQVDGNSFLELVRLGEVTTSWDEKEAESLLIGVRCFLDSRRHIPSTGITPDGFRAFAYWAKHLQVKIDLLCIRSRGDDQLAVAVPPCGAVMAGGGLAETPRVFLRTHLAPVLVLWPEMLGLPASREPAVFELTAERRAPEALVEVIA